MVAKLLAQQCIASGLLGNAELVRLLIHAPAAVGRIADSGIDDAVGKKFLYLLDLLRRDGIIFADLRFARGRRSWSLEVMASRYSSFGQFSSG